MKNERFIWKPSQASNPSYLNRKTKKDILTMSRKFNEIVHYVHDEIQNKFWMKSKPLGFDEIKSVFYPCKARFHHKVISSTVSGFIPSEDGFS